MSTQNTAITTIEYRAEAAERLSDNYAGAIADIVKNSGVQSLIGDRNIPVVEDTIDLSVRLVAAYFLRGNKTQLPGVGLGRKVISCHCRLLWEGLHLPIGEIASARLVI